LAGKEGADAFVQFRTKTGYLAPADAGRAHSLHKIVHCAGRDTMDVGFLDHRRECLLGGSAGLEE
jgi:hypothetical protein